MRLELEDPVDEFGKTGWRWAKRPRQIALDNPDDLRGALKQVGGSQSDDWNSILANQTVQTLWLNLPRL